MEPSDWFVVAGLVMCVAVAALPVILVARFLDQHDRDRKRRTYILRFPPELDSDQVLAFIHAVTGTLRPLPLRLLGTPNLVLELLATEEGITHRLRVPWTHSDFILQQLRQALPGIRIEEAEALDLPDWHKVMELGQTNRSQTLRIHNPDSIASSILAGTQNLSYGEVVMLQWVVSPAIPTRPPQLAEEKRLNPRLLVDKDKITDQRTKLSEPNIAAVVRIAATAMTEARATHLVFQMRAALASVRSPHTRFRQSLILPPERLRHRVTKATGPVVFPITLAASELVPLLAWPIGEPHVAGLPQVRARQLPPSSTIPSDGLLKVGVSNWTGLERPLTITEAAATMHVYLCGRTGVGKTTLLSNMALEAIDKGAGLIALESKGDRTDFFHTVLRGIPESRIDDVIVMDVADGDYPVGFNVLAQGRHEVIASDLQGIFESMYGRGLRADKSLYHGLMTLMDSKAAKQPMTFVDLVPLFSPMGAEETAYADEMIRGLQDDYLRNFWQDVENKSRLARDNYFQSIQSRIWQLNNRADVRRIIGQSKSTFDMAQVIRDKKILLVNLAGLGDTAALLGTLVVDAAWRAVKNGAADPSSPTSLVLDEFQNYLDLPISPETMLATARSHGLSLVLANQQLSQLPSELRSAVMGNARNKVIFQTYSEDAKAFSEEFGKRLSAQEFMNLGPYEVVCQLLDKHGASQLVTGVTRPPLKRDDNEARVRTASREKYSRPAEDVDLEIKQRRSMGTDGVKQRRPKMGGRSWQDLDQS